MGCAMRQGYGRGKASGTEFSQRLALRCADCKNTVFSFEGLFERQSSLEWSWGFNDLSQRCTALGIVLHLAVSSSSSS